jgi:amidohydrolase
MSLDMDIIFETLLHRARNLQPQMIGWRRAIHRRPELGFEEYETAALVNRTLAGLGIETRTGIAKTGLLGRIDGGSGRVVALRADMDALPIEEDTGYEFTSSQPGIMHACGHDAHTAMLLGAATLLKELADQELLPGGIRLIFQPSEEFQDAQGKSGAMRMVEEGALEEVDAIFAIHIDPDHPVGVAATRPGPMLAAADTFHIDIHGPGGHAARPHDTVDTIALAALLINAIHHLVSRRLNPQAAGVITIATIHGGVVDNIIPEVVKMTGTIRSFTPESRLALFAEIEAACGIIGPLGGRHELKIIAGYPPTINDPAATLAMQAAARVLLGDTGVIESPMYMGAEDFSFFTREVPGCFLSLGTHDPAWGDDTCQLHQPVTRMSEDAMPYGAAIMAAAALEWMKNA